MLVKFINSVVTATHSTIEKMLGQTCVRGQIGASPTDVTAHQINIVCEISGEVNGFVIFGMSLKTADRIASSMMGEQVITFDEISRPVDH